MLPTFVYIRKCKFYRVSEASRCLKLRLLLAPALDRCKAPFFVVIVFREQSKNVNSVIKGSSSFKMMAVKCDLCLWHCFNFIFVCIVTLKVGISHLRSTATISSIKNSNTRWGTGDTNSGYLQLSKFRCVVLGRLPKPGAGWSSWRAGQNQEETS